MYKLSCTARKVFKYGVFPGSYFPVFGLNTEIYRSFCWSAFSCIRSEYGDLRIHVQSEYRKIWTRKNSVFAYITQCYFKWSFSWWSKISSNDTSLQEKRSWWQNKLPNEKRLNYHSPKRPVLKQLNSFFERKLSSHLYGFRSRYGIQQVYCSLFKWLNWLGKSGVVGTMLMNFSKAVYAMI